MKRALHIFMALLICMTVSTGYVYADGGRSAGKVVDDAVITTAINGKIVKDSELKFFKINVDTKKGHVTLTGKVPNKKAEDRLIRLAEKVEDVKSVKSNLTIGN